jgi:hypothetical protein
MAIWGYPWISMDIHGYADIHSLTSIDIHGFHGYPKRSMDIHGSPSTPMKSMDPLSHPQSAESDTEMKRNTIWCFSVKANIQPKWCVLGQGILKSIAFVCQFQGWGRLMELVGYTYHQMCVVFRSLVWVKHPINIIPSLSLNLGLFFFMHIYIQAF